MKILWFCNTPCLASDKLSPDHVIGGWLYSINEQLINYDNIELSVCFYFNQDLQPFKYRKTTYFPIFRKAESSVFKKIKNRMAIKPIDNNEVSKLLGVVNLVKPDIIHIHGSEDNFGLIQYYINKPIVLSLQGILSPILEKYFSGIPNAKVSKFEDSRSKLFLLSINRVYRRLYYKAEREQKILENLKHIIGRTDWDKRVSRILAPKSQYFIVNEILRSEFYNVSWNKTSFDEPLQLISTMSDNIYKGFETIVKTALILKKHSEIKFTWNVIGLSEYSSTVKLVKRWLKVEFAELNIKFLGTQKPSQIVKLFLVSDIYCQVSHIENSPNSLCEAMLVGMPIIATFAGGTSTLLEDKIEGILIQEGDPYAYAGAIKEMYYNPEQSMRQSKNAQLKAKQTHNKEKIANDLVNIYKSLV